MRSSCVTHLSKEALVIIRESYVNFCGGDVVEAALISFFEYWHNVKIAMQDKNITANKVAERHGEAGTQDESLYQFHNLTELSDGIMRIGGETKIKSALVGLVKRGVISIHRNPNPRYKFDKTSYYLFHPSPLQKFIDNIRADNDEANLHSRSGETAQFDQAETPHRSGENALRSGENAPRWGENAPAITETTSKISSKDIKTKALSGSPLANTDYGGVHQISKAKDLKALQRGTEPYIQFCKTPIDPKDKDALRFGAKEIIRFLNNNCNTKFRDVDSNLRLIMARLASGVSVAECREIINMKHEEWERKPEMLQYLRPATLFNETRFEQYLGQFRGVKD